MYTYGSFQKYFQRHGSRHMVDAHSHKGTRSRTLTHTHTLQGVEERAAKDAKDIFNLLECTNKQVLFVSSFLCDHLVYMHGYIYVLTCIRNRFVHFSQIFVWLFWLWNFPDNFFLGWVKQRRTAETLCNKQSSRSHQIFTLKIFMKEKTLDEEEIIKTVYTQTYTYTHVHLHTNVRTHTVEIRVKKKSNSEVVIIKTVSRDSQDCLLQCFAALWSALRVCVVTCTIFMIRRQCMRRRFQDGLHTQTHRHTYIRT